jgi:chitinase domain-containing protein 1
MGLSRQLEWLPILLCLLPLLLGSQATLSRGDKKKKADTIKNTVKARAVGDKPLSAGDILDNYEKYSDEDTYIKRFAGPVLGYVTPWNSHGYDVAKIFGRKFSLVSPVWLQVIVSSSGYSIGGLHDMDRGWVEEVRTKGARLVPRLLFDQWAGQHFVDLFSKEAKQSELEKLLLSTAREHGLDGLTVEVWSQLGGQAR